MVREADDPAAAADSPGGADAVPAAPDAPETLPPAAAFHLKPREGAAPAHADSNDKDDDLTGVGDAEAAATGDADQHGVKDDMDEDCDEACASGAENVAGAEANEAVESGDHLTADTNEDAMDREDVSAKFGSEQLGSDRFEVDGGGGGEEDVADCGHQETSRKREVDGDGGGHGEREGDEDESREAAEKREGDSNDAPSAEVCGSRVKDEEMEAGGGVAKEDLQEEEGGLDERAPSDVKMKDVKDEADGTEAGDVEENAGLGTAASDSRDHDAIAAMLSMANGDVSMDDGEAREIADRKPKDGSPTDAATGGSEPSSTHATGQAGAATTAASAREPSPAGPKDPMSSAKALLAAKLKTRPQSTHVQLGAVTVKRLGTVVSDRPAYHSRRFLYPVGFLSERTYSSYRQAGGKTVYTCEILDGGERPEFKISVADDVDNPIVAGDPTSAWRVVEQRVQALPANGEARNQQRLCGAVYFGLAHPSIIKRLQELGGAKKCEKYLFDRKHAQLLETASEAEPQQAICAPRSPTHLSEVVGRNNIGSGAGAARANDTSVLKHLGTTDTDVAGEWLPIMEKELAMIKDRTNATIQPLSKSQLLPDGWSPQEVETFFNGLNEHQMQAAPLAAAITTKSAQQVHDYTQYVCEVMDRRVKASREEQLQKHASALQTAMQAASHASSAKDAGAVALQAAMVAAANVPKEATQLKEMFKQPTGHSTLAQVLTHLWHTERLWRHALQQGLQLFQETHQLSDRMMERLHNLRNKLVKASAQKSSSGGLGGVSDAMLKKRLEEESKKIRAEFSEKTKKMLEQERQIKKLGSDLRRAQEDVATKHADLARCMQDMRDLEVSRDGAISQMAEGRAQLLKEQKARHALMLRKERLEAEVIRQRGLHEGEMNARRMQEALARDALGRNQVLEQEMQQQRETIAALQQQLEGLGHAAKTNVHLSSAEQGAGIDASDFGGAGRVESDWRGAGGTPSSLNKVGGGAAAQAAVAAKTAMAGVSGAPRESVIGRLARLSVPNWKRRADGSWGEGEGRLAKQSRSNGGTGQGGRL